MEVAEGLGGVPAPLSQVFVGKWSVDRVEKLPKLQPVPCVCKSRQAQGFWKPPPAATEVTGQKHSDRDLGVGGGGGASIFLVLRLGVSE